MLCGRNVEFLLGAFAKLRKASISDVMSVRLSVCIEQFSSSGRLFKHYANLRNSAIIFNKASNLKVAIR